MTIKKIPEHYICSCNKVLIWFGEKGECEILQNKNNPVGVVRNIKAGNVYKMKAHEKAHYFKEKYD